MGMRPAIENGELALPLEPSTRLQMVAVDDIGGFAARDAVAHHAGGREVELEAVAGLALEIADRRWLGNVERAEHAERRNVPPLVAARHDDAFQRAERGQR